MNQQKTELFSAVSNGNNQDINSLLMTGIDLNFENEAGTTLLCIAAKCRFDIVVKLCEHGADVNYVGADRISALHWAVEYDNDEIITYLISHGAELHHQDKLLETPLHWACWTGHIKAARLLVESGADKNKVNVGGKRPIDLAIMQEHKQLVAYLE